MAQENRIAGFVLDGAIRDLAEVRAQAFPVFARGVVPIAGAKDAVGTLTQRLTWGGVNVTPVDVVVADEEGIVVIPFAEPDRVLAAAQARAAKDTLESLASWEAAHRARIEELLRRKAFES